MTSSPHRDVSRVAPDRGQRLALVLLAAVGVALVGCRPKPQQTDPDVQVAIRFNPSPPAVGSSTLDVTLTDASGRPLRITDLAVEGDMNHSGMKPVFARLKETAPGHYTGRLDFTMGGDWLLLFSGDKADGGHFEKRTDVRGVIAK